MSQFSKQGIGKWNFQTREYEPYEIPKDWFCPLYTKEISGLSQEINCANCGAKEQYGVTYTSRKIHNRLGLGFAVCESCYNKEIEEENATGTEA